jgi:hypothetical protein
MSSRRCARRWGPPRRRRSSAGRISRPGVRWPCRSNCEALARAGIPALALKGPALAARIYGDLAARQFCDLDILIARRHLSAAGKLLASLDYRSCRPVNSLPERSYEAGFVHADGRSVLELQWAIAPAHFGLSFDFDEAWSRRSWVSLPGGGVPVLAAADEMLQLCIHGAKHGWFQLKWILDLARAVATFADLDWRGLGAFAATLGASRMLNLGLLLARDAGPRPLPEAIRTGVSGDAVAASMARRILSRIRRGDRVVPAALEERWFQLLVRERMVDRLASAARMISTPTEADGSLGPWPVGVVARPFRLVSSHLLGARKLF